MKLISYLKDFQQENSKSRWLQWSIPSNIKEEIICLPFNLFQMEEQEGTFGMAAQSSTDALCDDKPWLVKIITSNSVLEVAQGQIAHREAFI